MISKRLNNKFSVTGRLSSGLLILGFVLLLAGGLLLALPAVAQDNEPVTEEEAQPVAARSPFHPTYALLDEDGTSVVESGKPLSTMQTCGACHDAEFIVSHSFHADVGLSNFGESGTFAYGQEWDTSPGLFGRWNPLTYRYLSPAGDEIIDLTTADWQATLGIRHVGGGPSLTARDGETPLDSLSPDADNLEAATADALTGELTAWDWQESGTVEMNCFLCHIPDPNNEARTLALQDGDFAWANSATLLGTGLIEQTGGSWEWNAEAFDEEGYLLDENVTIRDPQNANCGQCHGLVHVEAQTPMVMNECTPAQWSTITSGQVYSPQRMSDSGVNLPDKHDLDRSWDVHAERVISCTDCHYSLNNPVYYQEDTASQPDHLIFDPRRIDLGEYLYRPLHQFAKGQSSQNTLAPELDNTLRRCESCHDASTSHDWLPYQERHAEVLTCESCHIPYMYAPARQYNDWTVLTADNTAQTVCRGVDEPGETFGLALISGFEPVLLPRSNADGTIQLAPHNLVTSWYWVYGDPTRPLPYRNLADAWFEGETYAADVVALFDTNGDDQLDDIELLIDTDEKEALIADRLSDQGIENPRIVGEVRPYAINHNVTHGEWATKDCATCHSEDSRLDSPMVLSDRVPMGTMPALVSSPTTTLSGEFMVNEAGQLLYQPQHNTEINTLYILGSDNVLWVDALGALLFLGVLFGITLHGGLRFFAYRRNEKPAHPQTRRAYMYSLYERQWHWLQTAVILGLIFTGLTIHKPEIFGMFSFRYVVLVHNILAAILVLNAALAAFYHFASGEIRQYLPEPRGFFAQSLAQAEYYLRGIFQGADHPTRKTPERKMNPLQQMTYLAILNILLPLQIITGTLMWGVQHWPEVAALLGGLPGLAPFHTLISWLFATFIVMHVYLTTTSGHQPLDAIEAMITGWEDIETDDNHTQEEVLS